MSWSFLSLPLTPQGTHRLMYLCLNLSQTDLCDAGLAFRCEDLYSFSYEALELFTLQNVKICCAVLLFKFVSPPPQLEPEPG